MKKMQTSTDSDREALWTIVFNDKQFKVLANAFRKLFTGVENGEKVIIKEILAFHKYLSEHIDSKRIQLDKEDNLVINFPQPIPDKHICMLHHLLVMEMDINQLTARVTG